MPMPQYPKIRCIPFVGTACFFFISPKIFISSPLTESDPISHKKYWCSTSHPPEWFPLTPKEFRGRMGSTRAPMGTAALLEVPCTRRVLSSCVGRSSFVLRNSHRQGWIQQPHFPCSNGHWDPVFHVKKEAPAVMSMVNVGDVFLHFMGNGCRLMFGWA